MAYCDLADGLRLHYEAFGEDHGRPAIVFLNGTAQTTTNWRPLALQFQKCCRVVLYDARCQGRSDCGAGPLTLAQHAYDLVQLLDHLGIEDCGLVGLSHGARVGLAASGKMEHRIAGLVLLSIGLVSSARMARAVTAWRAALASGGLDALMQAMMPVVFGERFLREHHSIMTKVAEALVARNDEEKMVRFLAAFDNTPSIESILPAHHLPSLVMAGEDDPLVSGDQARALAEQLGGEYRSLEDIGHSIPAEAPDVLMHEVDDFFETNCGHG
jgi:pimeloyl-ACP methyl ester carboxylesterase